MKQSTQPESLTWSYFEDDERAAVEKALRSGRVNYWTGSETRSFENDFYGYCGAAHGVAVADGTVVLELAPWALKINAGDKLLVRP